MKSTDVSPTVSCLAGDSRSKTKGALQGSCIVKFGLDEIDGAAGMAGLGRKGTPGRFSPMTQDFPVSVTMARCRYASGFQIPFWPLLDALLLAVCHVFDKCRVQIIDVEAPVH